MSPLLLLVGVASSFVVERSAREASTTPLGAKATRKEVRQRYPKAGKLTFVLTKDAEPFGKEGDVIRVARGFALNYLTPKRLGVPASNEVIAEFEAKRAAAEAEEEAKFEAAVEAYDNLAGRRRFQLKRKVNDQGKTFAAVHLDDVKQLIEAATKLDLADAKFSSAVSTIDNVGDFQIEIKLHPKITVPVLLAVRAEE